MSADTKSLREETDSSSPNPVSFRVQLSLHVALFSCLSSLTDLRAVIHVVLVGVQHIYPHTCPSSIDC